MRVSTRTVCALIKVLGDLDASTPVESLAGLVCPVAELPRTPGAVSTIGSSTVSGSSMAITSSSTTSDSTPAMFSVMNGELVVEIADRKRELVVRRRIHEVEFVRITVKKLDRPASKLDSFKASVPGRSSRLGSWS